MRPAAPTVQKRIIDHFGAGSIPAVTPSPVSVGEPAGTTSTSTAVTAPLPDVNYKVTSTFEQDDDYLYFPPEDSRFLLNLGAEADDTARRLNKLQDYTNGLLAAIKRLNNLKVNPPLEVSK